MNPLQRTFAFVGVAVLSALLAIAAWKGSQPSQVAGYGDVGQEFFPDFDDVTTATALTVVDYDGDEKDVVSFSVRQNDDGLWVIPSHHNYPAEAEDRLARTATSLMGVKKTAIKSRSKDDWKRHGVVDPSDDGAATAEERGTRLTLSDGSGNPLVDLIVGSKVEGQDKQYHVREPEKNTTYVTELDIDLSAKFSDWIEPDLLKINSTDVVKITLDNYSIDEQRGTVDKKELLEFTKEDLKTSGDWKLAELNEETEELDKTPVSSIATNLDQLKIVGVRPKPEGVGDDMRVNPAVKQILQMQMQAQGYFIGGDKDGKERLYSNEGELIAGISNGVQYTLFFGEIARGSGKEIEVGLSDGEKPDNDADKDGETAEEDEAAGEDESGPRRYLLVKAEFNESLLGEKPVAPTEPVKPEILNETKEGESEEKAKTDETAKEDSDDKPADEAADDDDSCDAADEEEASEKESASDEPATPSEEKPAAETTEEEPAKESPAADDKPAEPAKEEPKPADDKKEEPAEEPKPDPKQVAQEAYDAAVKEYESAKKKYDADVLVYEDKVKEGQEKADELSTRFAGWYYVISSDSFEKFRIARKDVVKAKEAEEAADEEKKDGE